MRWSYYIDESDRDQHGTWTPRLVFADGMVTRSSHSITGLESLEDVRKEIGGWSCGSMEGNYGKWEALEIKRQWLERIAFELPQ